MRCHRAFNKYHQTCRYGNLREKLPIVRKHSEKLYITTKDIPRSQDMTPIKTYRFWLCTFLKRMPDENLSKYHKHCHTACINSIVKAMGNQLLFIVIYWWKIVQNLRGRKRDWNICLKWTRLLSRWNRVENLAEVESRGPKRILKHPIKYDDHVC